MAPRSTGYSSLLADALLLAGAEDHCVPLT
jgi:hypothetical protein